MGQFWLVDADMSKLNTPTWRDEITTISSDPDNRIAHHTIYTPDGTLTYKTAGDRKTTWITEYLIKHDEDIDLIRKHMPVPALDPAPIAKRYDEVGDAGILRGFVWGDQAGCWQHAACLYDITELIYAAMDRPDWVHALLDILLQKKLQFIETMRGAKFDLIETGGGSASSTLISPKLHREFCLPYDRQMHDALHSLGFKITYHTCGGTRGIEELIIANGADASETLGAAERRRQPGAVGVQAESGQPHRHDRRDRPVQHADCRQRTRTSGRWYTSSLRAWGTTAGISARARITFSRRLWRSSWRLLRRRESACTRESDTCYVMRDTRKPQEAQHGIRNTQYAPRESSAESGKTDGSG